MNKLSLRLQAKIQNLPLNTIVNENESVTETMSRFKDIVDDPIPKSFDGVKVWNKKLTPVWNQGTCGSCWAFTAASTLSDRFNIQSLGIMNIMLSPTELLLCDSIQNQIIKETNVNTENIENITNFACNGNTLVSAVHYIFAFGISSIECVPYHNELGTVKKYQSVGKFQSNVELPLCTEITGTSLDMCSDYLYNAFTGETFGTPGRSYKSCNNYGLYGTQKSNPKGGIKQLQIDIYKWGPICAAFKIYPNFYTFDAKNEIYEWDGKGEQIGGHAVEIVGWGEENGKLFWQIKNTWGEEWGINGYFRMIRGVNNCEIENNCLGVMPDFFYPIEYSKKQNIKTIDMNKNVVTDVISKGNLAVNDVTSFAGGWDNTTGYSRRVMTEYPWLDLTSPIPVDKLPDWDTFIAGRSLSNNMLSKSTKSDISNTNIYMYIVIGIFVLLFVILLVVLLMKRNVS